MIEAITFDFWSTLYKGRSVDYTQRLLNLKAAVERGSGATFELEQFKNAVEIARRTWSQTWTEHHRTIGAEEWLGIIVAELETSLPASRRLEIQTDMENSLLHALPSLVPEAKPVLAELAAAYRLAIISDTGITPGRVLRQILEKDDLLAYFDHLTFSDEIGRSKPHPEAFLITLRRLGVSPEQAVHVGDLLRTDIAGAKGVNMRAVQYTGLNQEQDEGWPPAPPISVTPDAIIDNHTDLVPLVEAWRKGTTAPADTDKKGYPFGEKRIG